MRNSSKISEILMNIAVCGTEIMNQIMMELLKLTDQEIEKLDEEQIEKLKKKHLIFNKELNIPTGYKYHWVSYIPQIERFYERIIDGWKPVPLSNHPEMYEIFSFYRDDPDKTFIYFKGCILCEKKIEEEINIEQSKSLDNPQTVETFTSFPLKL